MSDLLFMNLHLLYRLASDLTLEEVSGLTGCLRHFSEVLTVFRAMPNLFMLTLKLILTGVPQGRLIAFGLNGAKLYL